MTTKYNLCDTCDRKDVSCPIWTPSHETEKCAGWICDLCGSSHDPKSSCDWLKDED